MFKTQVDPLPIFLRKPFVNDEKHQCLIGIFSARLPIAGIYKKFEMNLKFDDINYRKKFRPHPFCGC